MAEDEFLNALTTLEDVLADNGRRASLIKKRIAQLRRMRSKGASYTELVSGDDSPLIVQLLTESSTALDTCGANARPVLSRPKALKALSSVPVRLPAKPAGPIKTGR